MVLVCVIWKREKKISIQKTRREATISSKGQDLQTVLAVWGPLVKMRHQLSSLLCTLCAHPYAPTARFFV